MTERVHPNPCPWWKNEGLDCLYPHCECGMSADERAASTTTAEPSPKCSHCNDSGVVASSLETPSGVEVEVGQVWQHVGRGGVPPTGLLIRILERRGDEFVCDYPDFPQNGTRIYKRDWKTGELFGAYRLFASTTAADAASKKGRDE